MDAIALKDEEGACYLVRWCAVMGVMQQDLFEDRNGNTVEGLFILVQGLPKPIQVNKEIFDSCVQYLKGTPNGNNTPSG